ncbi:MAG: hypothetical protein VB089_13505, partial [Anaerolineaceae bacterium]|nr:hypothetical protein [Anaerolineaceae bacterium]
MVRLAARRLIGEMPGESYFVTTHLVEYYLGGSDAPILEDIRQAFLALYDQKAVNFLWREWARSRAPALAEILSGLNWAASHPAALRTLSLLFLQRTAGLDRIEPGLIPAVAAYAGDADPAIATRAQGVLAELKDPQAIDSLCALWAAERTPLLEEILLASPYRASAPPQVSVLVALLKGDFETLFQCEKSAVEPLWQACRDPNPVIAHNACLALPNLHLVQAVNEFCRLWAATRDAQLEAILLQSCYVARSPLPLRLLSALKNGKIEIAQDL